MCMFPQFHMAGWTFTTCRHGCAATRSPSSSGRRHPTPRRRRPPSSDPPLHDPCGLAPDPRGRSAPVGPLEPAGRRYRHSATPPELLAAIHDALPSTSTVVIYGSTEVGGVHPRPDGVADHPNSVGRARRACTSAAPTTTRSGYQQPEVFGVTRNAEATAVALVDGGTARGARREGRRWVRPDHRALEGHHPHRRRVVAPAEVDQVLASHPAVFDAAVAGVPDVDWGESSLRSSCPAGRDDLARRPPRPLRRPALTSSTRRRRPRLRDPSHRRHPPGAADQAGPAHVDHAGCDLSAAHRLRSRRPPGRRRRAAAHPWCSSTRRWRGTPRCRSSPPARRPDPAGWPTRRRRRPTRTATRR